MIADLSHFFPRRSALFCAPPTPTPTPTCPLSRSLSSPTTVDPCCHSASSSFWIGAYDSYLEGSFRWLDGSHVDYNDAWANNNPAQQEGARTNSDCVRVAKVDDQWRWLDAGCDVALDGFACSPISPPLPPSPPAPPLVCCSSPPLAQLLLITRRQNFACCLPCFRRSISPAGRDFDPQPGTPSGGSSFNGRLGRAKACCLSSHRCAMSCCQG